MKLRTLRLTLIVTGLILGWVAVYLLGAEPVVAADTLPPDGEFADTLGIHLWTYTGPEQQSPLVVQFAIDNNNPSIIYAATNQGVFRSVDGGESWIARNGGLGSYGHLAVTGIQIDPTNSNTLYISTWGGGLLKSTDGGLKWSSLANPLISQTAARNLDMPMPPEAAGIGPSSVAPEKERGNDHSLMSTMSPSGVPIAWQRTAARRIVINPSNVSEIFACIDDGHGLYHSQNGGTSWSRVSLGSGSARSYTFAPSNTNIRYASFGTWYESGGFYRTSNGGVNWTSIPTTTIPTTVIDVAIHPTNSSIVLAATRSGVYRSTNGGVNWTQVNSSESSFYSVAFAPSNPNIAYAGGYTWVYRSTDSGVTWSNADTSFPAWYVEGLTIHPTQPETVFVGSNQFGMGGVYKRTDPGTAFYRKTDGMQFTIVLDIEQDPTSNSTWYASTWGGGIFRSIDNGATWTAKNSAGVPYIYDIEAVQGPTSTILYAATFYSDWGILKSYDRGDSWEEVSWSYPSFISFDLQSNEAQPNLLVAATYAGIQYSSDGAVTWHTAGGLDPTTGIVMRLCSFPGTDRMLAATYGGGVFYSGYRGFSWYEANTGITSYNDTYYTFDVACAATPPGAGYVAALGMYRTRDYGETWSAMNGGLPLTGGYPPQFRTVDVVPYSGDVYAGAYEEGVFMAPEGRGLWRDISTGLTERRIRSLAVTNSFPTKILAGTNGKSIWDCTYYSFGHPRVYLPVTLRSYTRISDVYEPNESLAQARQIPGPGTYRGFISSASDEDWFKFTVSKLGPITMRLDVPSGTDYDLYFYRANGQVLGRSTLGTGQSEDLQFHPISTGTYYIRVDGWNSSHSTTEPYSLHLACNENYKSGDIYGKVKLNQQPLAGVVINLSYYDGYRSRMMTTLTNTSGDYRFGGMSSLPVGHTYEVSYRNHESVPERLGSWYCYISTTYQHGTNRHMCDFDVAGIALIAPGGGSIATFPATFRWQTRGISGDEYWATIWRHTPSYARFSSNYQSGGTYVLSGLPTGFSYGITNWWHVGVSNDSDKGYGYSYYNNGLTFSSSVNNFAPLSVEQRAMADWCIEKDSFGCTTLQPETILTDALGPQE